MHNQHDSEQRKNDGEKQKADGYGWPDWLPKWLFRLLGPISLIVVVAALIAAYIAHYYVTKDSPRIVFRVGLMQAPLLLR